MKYGSKDISDLTDAELDAALAQVSLQRESFVSRVANAPEKKRNLVQGPGTSFLATEAALQQEKAKRGT